MIQLPRWLLVLASCASFCSLATGQITEVPQTVAPGKVLFEIDGVRLSLDREGPAGNKYTAVGVADSYVSVGITPVFDVQAGFGFYHRETYEFSGIRDSHSGLGDVSLRMKWTFWKNEEWGAAAAVIPWVKVPVNDDGIGNNSVEGGFIVPWSMDVSTGLTAGAMFAWDHLRNANDDGYDAYWTLTGIMRQEFPLGIWLYAETLFEATSDKFSDWAGSLGAGVGWQLTSRLALDYEIVRGLNSRATDWTHVLRVYWEW